jgi:hypothetical protein
VESGVTKYHWYSEGYGYIILYKTGYNQEQVFSILKSHGVSGIIQFVGKIFDIPCVLITFNPIGHKERKKGEVGSGIMIDAV